jgi:hypothetical protein
MTADLNSSSTQYQVQGPSATGTSPLIDLAQKTVSRESAGIDPSSEINADLTSKSVTSSSDVSRVNSTLTEAQPLQPSVDDAISTPFIDARSVGVDTWPIRGTQKWEGKVVEVKDGIFTVELTPLGPGDDRKNLTAEFKTKVLEDRADSLQAGDIIYVTSQEVRMRGLLKTSYAFHVRRPGNWTESDLRDIRERALKRLQLLEENVE